MCSGPNEAAVCAPSKHPLIEVVSDSYSNQISAWLPRLDVSAFFFTASNERASAGGQKRENMFQQTLLQNRFCGERTNKRQDATGGAVDGRGRVCVRTSKKRPNCREMI